MKTVFIIGSKGIPAKYGGFETFVDYLTAKKKSENINYHVYCLWDNYIPEDESENFIYNDAVCHRIKVPEIGPAKAVLYDILSLRNAIDYAAKNNIDKPIFYILASRIGPFLKFFRNEVKKLNGQIILNPDGHEWKREKWNYFIRWYWKYSEKLMVKYSDYIICDSQTIRKYIQNEYNIPENKTRFIAYGADIVESNYDSENQIVKEFFDKFQISKKQYYLVVGRFVPENNYYSIIAQFLKSNTRKKLLIISDVHDSKLLRKIKSLEHFEKDSRIILAGTVYDKNMLKYIRQNAYGYIHGHEVGGTNPSLLESLGFTDLNLLLDVGFNREVGLNSSLYWNKDNLALVIENADDLTVSDIQRYSEIAKRRIQVAYSWNKIVKDYETFFEEEK